jgi:hypothetical protein
LHYRGGATFDSLWINERARRDPQMLNELDWELVTVGDRTLEISDPSPEKGSCVVALEQEGTWVDLISDLSREDLCRVAASLEPASR